MTPNRDLYDIIADLQENEIERQTLVALRDSFMHEMYKSGAYSRNAIAQVVGLSYGYTVNILQEQAKIEMYLREQAANLGPRPGPPIDPAEERRQQVQAFNDALAAEKAAVEQQPT